MSTRACYTFTDESGDIHVYKHHDGYPFTGGVHNGQQYEGGGLVWINNAKPWAWELPRFEADEFAAAFVAANKEKSNGGIRLINKANPWEFSSDSEYWYKVKIAVPALDVFVQVYSVDWWSGETSIDQKFNTLIMEGALSELIASERTKKKNAA
jgi:hypothetical protein